MPSGNKKKRFTPESAHRIKDFILMVRKGNTQRNKYQQIAEVYEQIKKYREMASQSLKMYWDYQEAAMQRSAIRKKSRKTAKNENAPIGYEELMKYKQTADKYDKFWKYVTEELPEGIRKALLVLIFTGMKVSELREMEWWQIGPEYKSIFFIEGTMKMYHMPDIVNGILREHYRLIEIMEGTPHLQDRVFRLSDEGWSKLEEALDKCLSFFNKSN